MSRPGMAESEWIPLTKPTDLAIRREQVSSVGRSAIPHLAEFYATVNVAVGGGPPQW